MSSWSKMPSMLLFLNLKLYDVYLVCNSSKYQYLQNIIFNMFSLLILLINFEKKINWICDNWWWLDLVLKMIKYDITKLFENEKLKKLIKMDKYELNESRNPNNISKQTTSIITHMVKCLSTVTTFIYCGIKTRRDALFSKIMWCKVSNDPE